MSPYRARVLASLFTVTLVAACSIGEIDVANKACPCGDAFVCDTARNVCVSPGQLAASAGSDAGTLCDDCPCGGDADCRDPSRPRCSPTLSRCVECLSAPSDTCPGGSYCNALSQCTLGCKSDGDCQISPASPRCDVARHQCVECLSSAQCQDNKVCSPSGTCVAGCDLTQGKTCATGACCDGFCVDTQSDPLSCGACGVVCSTTNGTPKCSGGSCSWTCASGFAHCASDNTGCETNTRSDATHCGSCTRNCNATVMNANGVACSAGSCAFTSCKTGFGDCDGQPGNGCECECGASGQRCCPGDVCNGGLRCIGNGKCQ